MSFEQILLSYGDGWLTLLFAMAACFFSFLAQKRKKNISNTDADAEKSEPEQLPAETPAVNDVAAMALSANVAAKEVSEDMTFSENYDVKIDVKLSGGVAVVTASCCDKKTGVALQGTECADKLRELADAICIKKEA